MNSRASIKSHPLHPILICFPIAFFTGSFVFDALFLVNENVDLKTTAYHLNIAGLIGAVMAAVPGLIDFIYTVPPESTGKKRAARHGLLNTINLLLFVGVVFFEKRERS